MALWRASNKNKNGPNSQFRTETNRNNICFGCGSVCCVKPKTKIFGLFRCFEPISKQSKQTELFQIKPKQPKIFWKIPKYALYQTVSVGLLFVSVQSKHGNSLFRYRIRNNLNKHFVSDSAETSFGFSFGCFESKLVSKDTLTMYLQPTPDQIPQKNCLQWEEGPKVSKETLRSDIQARTWPMQLFKKARPPQETRKRL